MMICLLAEMKVCQEEMKGEIETNPKERRETKVDAN
jgi:hypothetical protein